MNAVTRPLCEFLFDSKALGRRTQQGKGAWANGTNPANGARVRWLSYWVIFGLWCHVSLGLASILRVIPLSRHLELALLLWFQVPVFRGAGRLLDMGEDYLSRWAAPPPAAARHGAQNSSR